MAKKIKYIKIKKPKYKKYWGNLGYWRSLDQYVVRKTIVVVRENKNFDLAKRYIRLEKINKSNEKRKYVVKIG